MSAHFSLVLKKAKHRLSSEDCDLVVVAIGFKPGFSRFFVLYVEAEIYLSLIIPLSTTTFNSWSSGKGSELGVIVPKLNPLLVLTSADSLYFLEKVKHMGYV